MPGLSRRSKSQGELREWGGRAWQQQWEEHPRGGSRPREDELWDDGGQWEEGGRWEVGGNGLTLTGFYRQAGINLSLRRA